MANYRSIHHKDKEDIVELFVGKSVVKVSDDRLLLSDGSKLQIVPNTGCGGCLNGNYDITELNECENIITNVETIEEGWEEVLHIFVYAENRKINLLTVEGQDNGYYGTGYWIYVNNVEGEDGLLD